MKKTVFFFVAIFATIFVAKAQEFSFKETFDGNSLEWNECPSKIFYGGTSIIDNGKLTITSKNEGAGWDIFCYSPLDIQLPFKIVSNVKVKKLESDRLVGLVFNYKDDGNYYCFAIDDYKVVFRRYVDGKLVGSITQGVKWKDKTKINQSWELVSDGQNLKFSIDGMPILNIKYMPLEYSGFGYYTFGKQELVVDDVEFIQL